MEEKDVLQKSPKRNKLKMTFAVLILAALLVVELYMMINFPKDYLFLGIVGLAILCFVYLITDLSFKLKDEKVSLYEKGYENIYKAQKVSYVFLKQSVIDLQNAIERIVMGTDNPIDEFVEAQKAIGKVTIQRNKDNTTEILNSIEKLFERIVAVEEHLEVVSSNAESQGNISSQINEELFTKQQEIILALNEAQDSIKDVLIRQSENLGSQIQDIPSAIPAHSPSSSTGEIEDALSKMQNLMESLDTEIKDVASLKPAMEHTEGFEEETVAEEAKPEAGSEERPESVEEAVQMDHRPEEPVSLGVEAQETEEPNFAAPKAEAVTEEADFAAPEAEAVTEETDFAAPEAEMAQEQTIVQPQDRQPAPQEENIPKPVPPVSNAVPAGRNMTPEEIAAMLGEVEEPPKPEEPAVEEKPAAPVSSDPGHIMTPEEIAALLSGI